MESRTLSRKACPVIIRSNGGRREILAFHHPLAGKQVVKGTIEPGEEPAPAALRELAEESGIEEAEIDRFLKVVEFERESQIWHLFLCKTSELPENWSHTAFEGDGMEYEFRFFWQCLESEPGDGWEQVFLDVLDIVRAEVSTEAAFRTV